MVVRVSFSKTLFAFGEKDGIVSSFWENMYSLIFVKEAEIFIARIVTTYFNGWQLLFVHGLSGL